MAATHEDRNASLSPGVAIKAPCRVATTAAITLSGEQTIDAVACVTGDRVLVKNQTSSIDNGIYGVSTGTWEREPDFDGNRDVVEGTIIAVNAGTTNADTMWRVTSTGAVVFGTTSLTFERAVVNNSNSVSFLQSGTGAVVRTVQDKLREVITSADFNDTKGVRNTGLGVEVLSSVGVGGGDNNTALGYQALKANTGTASVNGRNNVAIGMTALKSNTTGQQNIAIGVQALELLATGDNNVAIGNGALAANTAGSLNVSIGTDALRVSTGASNTAVGASALQSVVANGANTAIGNGALLTTTGSGGVAIGFNAGRYETGSNSFYVDNQDRTDTAGDKAKALLYGTFDALAANQRLQQNAIITKPVQPAFLVTASVGTDVTGDATTATVAWGTEIYDQHSDFSANTFTAPVTGRYHFDVTINSTGLAAGNTLFLVTLVASNRSVTLIACNPGAIIFGGQLVLSGGTDIDMDAADTVTVTYRADGGAKVVDISTASTWSGHLVC